MRKILFHTAIAVVLLHAFIPHPHSNEITEKEHIEIHQSSKSIFGIISVAFHESNDESLDSLIITPPQFEKNTEKKYLGSTITISKDYFAIAETVSERIPTRGIERLTDLFIATLNGVRGPPLAS